MATRPQAGIGSSDINASTRPQVGVGNLKGKKCSAGPLSSHDTGTERVVSSSGELQGSLFARPLAEPKLNLALPEKNSLDSDGVEGKNQKVPCAMSSPNDEVRLLKRFEAGNYEGLFLSSLPKGSPVPPSGPSKRTNGFNN
ncbi:hypothetical protein CTI12_AA584550 [Artemisia annua]|uniref:Uncharacterized protein n=1 Tax=Artemisia annua TaxID=35608 RepID=A0A2U1KMN9_ARTAN|nr:hypothetical protein CTI12_AA584550 [Artemisia annua]